MYQGLLWVPYNYEEYPDTVWYWQSVNIEISSFSDIFVEWLPHWSYHQKAILHNLSIFMLHFIRNFENSLIFSNNISLIFQFDLYHPNKFISFIFFIFNRPLCIERDHSRKDWKRIRYFTLQFYNWVKQVTALFVKGETVLIANFYADSPELIRNFSIVEPL